MVAASAASFAQARQRRHQDVERGRADGVIAISSSSRPVAASVRAWRRAAFLAAVSSRVGVSPRSGRVAASSQAASRHRPAAISASRDPRVIGVEPGDLVRRQQRRLDQPPVDRRQRQRLEGVERLLGARDRRPSTTSTRFSMRMP